MKDKLQADLKTAMLARETEKVDTLKGLKSAILYAEVEQGKREEGLDDSGIMIVLKKEAKKRQDSVDMYRKGGNEEQAAKELREKAIIDAKLNPKRPFSPGINLICTTKAYIIILINAHVSFGSQPQ